MQLAGRREKGWGGGCLLRYSIIIFGVSQFPRGDMEVVCPSPLYPSRSDVTFIYNYPLIQAPCIPLQTTFSTSQKILKPFIIKMSKIFIALYILFILNLYLPTKSMYLSLYLLIYQYLSIYLLIYLSIYLFIYLSIYQSITLSEKEH